MHLNLDFQEKKGIALTYLNQLDQAQKVFQFILQEHPKRPVALCNFGFTKALQNDFGSALAFYDRAIALDPDYEQALINKAALLKHLRKEKESDQLLKRVLEINPNNLQAKQFLN